MLIPLILTIIALLIVTVALFPRIASAPINKVIHTFSETKNIYSEKEIVEIFPESKILEENWEIIKKESEQAQGFTGNLTSHFNLLDENDLKGWDMYPMKVLGNNVNKNLEKCPFMTKFLNDHPNVYSAFFSIIRSGKHLTPHTGPYAGILRYQLGLDIPKGECFITIGGEKRYWENGKSLLFDETFLHSVNNDTLHDRTILFIDIAKPLPGILKMVNNFNLKIIKKII